MLRRLFFAGGVALLALLAIAASASAKPGDIYVGTDGGDDSLVRIDPKTGAVSEVAKIADGLGGMDFAANGSLYVGDYFDGSIYRVKPVTGAFSSFLSGAPLVAAYDIDRGPGNVMYVADNGGSLLSFKPGKAEAKVLRSGSDYDSLSSLAIRFSDRTVFSASYDGRVMSDNLRTGAHRVISSDAALVSPEGIALTPAGKLYVNSGDNVGTIYRVSTKSGVLTPVASGDLLDSGGSDCNYELGVDLDGQLLVANICGDRIVRVDPKTGAQETVAQGTSADPGNFLSPEGITVEPPRCAGKLATIVGSGRKDVLKGSSAGDVIASLGGNDVIRGGGGADVVCGGKGGDRLIGGKGRDRLNGQAGRDTCLGGPGRDRLKSC